MNHLNTKICFWLKRRTSGDSRHSLKHGFSLLKKRDGFVLGYKVLFGSHSMSQAEWAVLDGYESRDIDGTVGPFVGDVSNARGLQRNADFVLYGL